MQSRFRLIPHGIRSRADGRPVGQTNAGDIEAHIFVNRTQQFAESYAFALDLIFCAENVRIVLHHLPHTHKAVQSAVRFIAVAIAEFRHADGEFAIAANALVENLHMTGAVHRLEAKHTRLFALRRFACARLKF